MKKKKCKNNTLQNKKDGVFVCSACDHHVCYLCENIHQHRKMGRGEMKPDKQHIELSALTVLAKSLDKKGFNKKKILKYTEEAIQDGIESLLETPKWKAEVRRFMGKIKKGERQPPLTQNEIDGIGV